MPYTNIEDQRLASKRHYAKNRKAIIANMAKINKEAKVRTRQIILTHLIEHPCVDCGEDDPVLLEFDHRGDKLFNIGEAARGRVGRKKLIVEIAKCDVRCANCHRRKTYKEHGEGWKETSILPMRV